MAVFPYARAALLAFCALPLAAHGQVYRCKPDRGPVVYQATPCDAGAQTKVATPASGSDSSIDRPPDQLPAYKLQLADVTRREQVRTAIAEGRPLVSMTRAELDEALGKPARVSSGIVGSSQQDRLIYQRRGRMLIVYLTDGAVVSFEDGGQAPAAPPRADCPSEHDIRKIETAISSYMNRGNDKLQGELRRQLREAKACKP